MLKYAINNILFYLQVKIDTNNKKNCEDIIRQFQIVNKKLINCDIKRFHLKRIESEEFKVLCSRESRGNLGNVLVNK